MSRLLATAAALLLAGGLACGAAEGEGGPLSRRPTPDMIEAVSDGSGPPPWHVHDQEARIRALPACALAPADRAALAATALRPYRATLWLPPLAGAEPADVPDSTWQGWEWPSGDELVVGAWREPGLPGVYALTGYAAGVCRATLAGRPVSVARWERAGARGKSWHRAVVDGYLDDTTSLHVEVDAGTPERRDALLAALLTLAPRA